MGLVSAPVESSSTEVASVDKDELGDPPPVDVFGVVPLEELVSSMVIVSRPSRCRLRMSRDGNGDAAMLVEGSSMLSIGTSWRRLDELYAFLSVACRRGFNDRLLLVGEGNGDFTGDRGGAGFSSTFARFGEAVGVASALVDS